MENSKLYIFVGLAFALFIFSGIFFVSTRSGFSPSDVELEECKTLQYNGNDKIGLLFFGQVKEVQNFANSFFSVSPFEENKDKFNIYYIDTFEPECESYGGGIAFICHSKKLIEKAASCDADHIIVLKEEGRKVRSTSYLGVMSINTVHPKSVLLHEFGHNFANLDEEYINGKKPKGLNCATSCEDFDDVDKCFLGCSKDDFQRTVNNGIMRTLSPSDTKNPFGDFNSAIIQSLIDKKTGSSGSGVTGNVVEGVNCEEERFILSEVDLLTGRIETSELVGCPVGYGEIETGDFTYSVLAGDDLIFSERFNSQFYTDAYEESGILSGDVFSSEDVGKILISSSIDIKGDTHRITDSQNNIIAEGELYSVGARLCAK